MGDVHGELECCLSIEKLTSSGDVSNKKHFKRCIITLGRDELRDILLKISDLNSSLERKFRLTKELQIHKKFIKNGMASIKINANLQVLISNCPPDKLCIFLKIMRIKCGVKKNPASDRTKLYNQKQRDFQYISPLTQTDVTTFMKGQEQTVLQDVKNVQQSKAKPKISDATPKRKRVDSDSIAQARKRINSNDNGIIDRCTIGNASKESQKVQSAPKGKCMSKEQIEVFQAIKRGLNVFFTGSAGTGKSYLLKRIIGALPPLSTVASASTGIAACQIGGITLHSFAGIGNGTAPLATCIELASRPRVAQQWKNCSHLVIDEISMVEADFFDKVEAVARVIRKSKKPFGGIQLVLCGDFLQLPPVTKGKDKNFCFQAKSWDRCIHINFELTLVKRQNDRNFINILQYIRVGKCPDDVEDKLRATSQHKIENNGIYATRLCTHKDNAEMINTSRMDEMKQEKKVFMSFDSESAYSKQMDKQLLVSEKLELKIGAQVMLTKNLDLHRGLVNGARGVVIRFQADTEGLPTVKFTQGEEILIKRERFYLKTPGGGIATRQQLPLTLAWAISIHKSQGLTLDCVEVSLAKVFEYGQSYVALSRAKTLEGLRVLDFDKHCVKAHPDVLRFYIKLRREMRTISTFLISISTSN